MNRPDILTSIADSAQTQSEPGARRKSRIALVPTMGALHAGHISLVKIAREAAERTVASVFVNPKQFAPGEDFDKYPRTFEADLGKLGAAGVDAVFAPPVDGNLPAGLCDDGERSPVPPSPGLKIASGRPTSRASRPWSPSS